MKTEQRHKLETNDLAEWLTEAIERIKPYTKAILGIVLAAAALITIYSLLASRSREKQAKAWTDYYTALEQETPEKRLEALTAVVNNYGLDGPPAAQWAEVMLGDLQLAAGINSLFVDKRSATNELEQAAQHFQAVADVAKDPLLKSRAYFGLARTQESRGKLTEAIASYEMVTAEDDGSPYGPLATSRIADLKKNGTKDWYAWFVKQEPVVPKASGLPGVPGERPPFDTSSLTDPSLGETLPSFSTIPPTRDKSGAPPTTDATRPDDSKTDDSKSDPSKTDSSKTDSAKTDSAKTDSAKTDETKTDAPKTDSEKSEPGKDDGAKAEPAPAPPSESKSEAPEKSEGATTDPSATTPESKESAPPSEGPATPSAEGTPDASAGKP